VTLRMIVFEADRPGEFNASLEDGAGIVENTRQPLVDGARELIARGIDPKTPLTMRHEGKAHDSFRPLPIGKWAGLDYEEDGLIGVRCRQVTAARPGCRRVGEGPSKQPELHT
jgi:hypothetical protein